MPTSPPAVAAAPHNGGGAKYVMSRGLQYIRQQSAAARKGAQPQPEEAVGPAAGEPGAAQGPSGDGGSATAAGEGGKGIKAQGKRVAGLMLNRLSSRMNEAGKAFAQHVQQARQQGSSSGNSGLRRLHSD